jgi:hypothetical protein
MDSWPLHVAGSCIHTDASNREGSKEERQELTAQSSARRASLVSGEDALISVACSPPKCDESSAQGHTVTAIIDDVSYKSGIHGE